MAEPRARARPRNQQTFNTADLTELLYAFGSQETSSGGQLPSTITCLDEILVDFIIETCHSAALCASYSRRQKIKVDDFKWTLRKDEKMLGRVLESMWKDKMIKSDRKLVDVESMGKEGVGDLEDIAEIGGVAAETKKKGRRKKRKAEDDAASTTGPRKKQES